MGPRELESLTSSVSTRRSNQLSYGPGTAIVPNLMRTEQTAAEWKKPPVSGGVARGRLHDIRLAPESDAKR